MSDNGQHIIYTSPASPGVWYCPETLLGAAALLLFALALWLLVRRLLFAGRQTEGPTEPEASDFEAQQVARASGYPPFQWTTRLLGWSLLLAALSISGVELFGAHSTVGDERSITINTSPGLPAAAAMLVPASLALFVTSLLVTLVGLQYGAAIVGTGLLSVVWLFTLAAMLLVVGAGTAVANPSLGAAVLAAAVICAVSAFWLRQARFGRDESVLEVARQTERQAEGEHARREASRAPEKGAYVSHAQRVYASPFNPLETDTQVLSLARRVRWDHEGVEAEWSPKNVKRFAWQDLVKLRYAPFGHYTSGAEVFTASGDVIRITDDGDNYDGITAALEAHIWGREQPGET